MLKQLKEKAKKLLDIVECKCDFAKSKFDKLIRVSGQDQVFLTDQKIFVGCALDLLMSWQQVD